MHPVDRQLSLRTQIINLFRRLLKFGPAERVLSRLSRRKPRRSLIWKLIPPEYLYKTSRRHIARINEICFDLDLSNYDEYFVFFGYTEPGLDRLFQRVESEFIIIDAGANIGFTALNFARRCPEGRVIAYEPSERNFDKLRINASLNQFNNLTVQKKGLGNTTATLQLSTFEHHTGMNRVKNLSTAGVPAENFEMVTLDAEVDALNLTRVDLIKIDVEGYEYELLSGAITTIRKFMPILYIELIGENLKQFGRSAEQVLDLLRDLDYELFDARKTEPLIGFAKFAGTDILCLPRLNKTKNG